MLEAHRREMAATAPLFAEGWGDPTLAERVDELLADSDYGTRYGTDIIGTLDEHHFRVVQSLSGRPLRIVPADVPPE